MAKYNVPERKYADPNGTKKMVSMRLPEPLLERLNHWAAAKGWNVTELVVTVLDEYVQFEEAKEKSKK